MQATTLQLAEVNQGTLIQWHNARVKRQDLAVLLQGVDLPGRIPVASEPLDLANVRPAVVPPQHQGEILVYHLAKSTAGQADLETVYHCYNTTSGSASKAGSPEAANPHAFHFSIHCPEQLLSFQELPLIQSVLLPAQSLTTPALPRSPLYIPSSSPLE
ncbi:hypothetical protein DPEC_G00099760 [Dallia pectoralis]|uniref:Uncharacterized protein n=1 Tax=Dallia pectoralis TaxID=75939 RepID=A0ACC2GW96_DALPE|nr:hypothetical protein DPEC_G00099760 [Dallia pectoralis]